MTDAPPLNPNPTNDPATSSAPTTVSTAPSLLPPPLKRKYDELAQDPEDTNPMSAEDAQTLKNIDAGTYEMSDKDYPSFFYKDGSYDPEDLEKGLLRGEVIPRFLRHIWVGPKSAVNGLKEGIPSGCNARLHNSFKIVPEMIGYAGVQARTALSTKDWRPRDGSFKYDKFFQRIVDLFADVDDPWVVETLAWFQNEVFGDNDAPASEPNDEDNADDVDPVLAQHAARRAAAAARATPESV
ncbi:hypothetical protein C8R46DRAFT_1296769 [Mycena filopes]|nr:hypothetical protein C8R46DRAFT_1296769 [Mycena filopes]